MQDRARWLPLVLCLATVELITGCLPVGQAGEPLTATPRATQVLSGNVQAGEVEELASVNERLSDIALLEFQVDNGVALAIVEEDGRTRPIAINLRSGEIFGLDSPLTTKSEWPTMERYFVWVASDVSGDSSVERVQVYDLHTGEHSVVGESDSQRWPDVSGAVVVWAEIRGSQSWDIYSCDALSRQLNPVVSRPFIQAYPKIEREWIVYLDDDSGDSRDVIQNVYLYNLTSGEDSLLGTSPFAFDCEGCTHGIGNGRVLWIGWSADEKEPNLLSGARPSLHVYDLETRTGSVLDLSPVCERVPAGFEMAGDLILFGCQDGFYGYDLAQAVFFDVPYPEHSVGSVHLSETYVVFRVQEQRESFWDFATPGASPMPPPEYWLTPQPARFRIFVAPITR